MSIVYLVLYELKGLVRVLWMLGWGIRKGVEMDDEQRT